MEQQQQQVFARPAAARTIGALAIALAIGITCAALPAAGGAHAAQQPQHPQPGLAEGQRFVVRQDGKYYYATVERLVQERGATLLRYRWTAGHEQGGGTLPLAQASGGSSSSNNVFTLEQARERGFTMANTLPDAQPAAAGAAAATTAAARSQSSGAQATTATAQATTQPTDGLDAAAQTAMVAAHNQWRRQVGVPDVSWSDRLAKDAQDWAAQLRQTRQCRIDASAHTRRDDVGENLAWRSPLRYSNGRTEFQPATPADIVNSWGGEKQNYDHAGNSCRGVCGHYTQLVWKTTTQIGCGRALCASDKSQVWVCRYAPPGNYVGQRPY